MPLPHFKNLVSTGINGCVYKYTSDKMIDTVIQYQIGGKELLALKMIYSRIFDAIKENDYSFLFNKSISDLSLTNLIGILTITQHIETTSFSYEGNLWSIPTRRNLLIDMAITKIRLECPEDEAEIMRGINKRNISQHD